MSRFSSTSYSPERATSTAVSERDFSPVLDANHEYTDDERLTLALASWYAKEWQAEKCNLLLSIARFPKGDLAIL